jgi:hypothetical protein
MRSTATLIAGLLPPEIAEAIRQITENKELLTLDEHMHPVANPELPEIARALPANGRPSVWAFWSAPTSVVCRTLRARLGLKPIVLSPVGRECDSGQAVNS